MALSFDVKNQIGPFGNEHRFKIAHDRRHFRIRTTSTDIQKDVRYQAELLEEHIGHVGAEVLARVYDPHVDRSTLRSNFLEARNLNEIRPGTDHDEDLLHAQQPCK